LVFNDRTTGLQIVILDVGKRSLPSGAAPLARERIAQAERVERDRLVIHSGRTLEAAVRDNRTPLGV